MALASSLSAASSAKVLMSRRLTTRRTLALIQRCPCCARYTRPGTSGSSSIQATVASSSRWPGQAGPDVASVSNSSSLTALSVVATIQSPRDTSTSRSSTMPALSPAATEPGWRTLSSTCATTAVWLLGSSVTLAPGSMLPAATRPQNTRRPCEVSADDENFSTHCTGRANGSSRSAGVVGRVCSTRSRLGPS